MEPKIFVMGATGKTGGSLVDVLLGRNVAVRAVVRRRDERSRALEQRGAEVVVADIFDSKQLADAMRGVQRAYFLPPIHPYAIQSAVAFARAARTVRLEAVVQMSQWLSHRNHPSIMTRQTWQMDSLLADIPGVGHTILNPGMFADNFLRLIDFASLLGIFPNLTGDATAAVVSNEDMARTAAAILLDPLPHAGKTYRPTGPKLLSVPEMAVIVGQVLGRSVRVVDLPFWMFGKVAALQRIDPFLISGFRHYLEDMRRGAFAFEGGVTDTVEALTGTAAESFEITARRYASLPFAKPTTANRSHAIANFLMTPLARGYDLDRLDRAFGFPMPSQPAYSIDDPEWRVEHARVMAAQPEVRDAPTRPPAVHASVAC